MSNTPYNPVILALTGRTDNYSKVNELNTFEQEPIETEIVERVRYLLNSKQEDFAVQLYRLAKSHHYTAMLLPGEPVTTDFAGKWVNGPSISGNILVGDENGPAYTGRYTEEPTQWPIDNTVSVTVRDLQESGSLVLEEGGEFHDTLHVDSNIILDCRSKDLRFYEPWVGQFKQVILGDGVQYIGSHTNFDTNELNVTGSGVTITVDTQAKFNIGVDGIKGEPFSLTINSLDTDYQLFTPETINQPWWDDWSSNWREHMTLASSVAGITVLLDPLTGWVYVKDTNRQMEVHITTTRSWQVVDLGPCIGSYSTNPDVTGGILDWGDGSDEVHITNGVGVTSTRLQHSFETPGEHVITLYGRFRWGSGDMDTAEIRSIAADNDIRPLITSIVIPDGKMSPIYDTAGSAFANCTQLTSIPSNIFTNCKKSTNFSCSLYNCKALTDIPGNLFINCTAAENFERCFMGCGAPPPGDFQYPVQ